MADLQTILEALSSPIRREILWLVWEEERTAGAIAREFNLAAPTISVHLGVLREAGLVTMRRDRNFRRYLTNQSSVRQLDSSLLPTSAKWVPADHEAATTVPSDTSKNVSLVVRVSVEVMASQKLVFKSFTDEASYSTWLDMPVTLRDSRFTCTLPWGKHVRGSYELVVEPTLIAFRWDFDAGEVPLPGNEFPGYLRLRAAGPITVVEIEQFVDDPEQAAFMETAWTWVLGRISQHFAALHKGQKG